MGLRFRAFSLISVSLAVSTLAVSTLLLPVESRAQDAALAVPGAPQDINGDGIVAVLGFGDSITFGVGDGTPVGADVESVDHGDGTGGYLRRIANLGGLSTRNAGVAGEDLEPTGSDRLVGAVANSNADYVVFLEGINDARKQLSVSTYRRLVQKSLNAIRVLGKAPVLGTLPPPCCEHIELAPIAPTYSSVIKDLALKNDTLLVDFDRAWRTTCGGGLSRCNLYNLPEGLHPNTKGYDVMGQVVLAALFGVDIFNFDGPMKLEEQLALAPGTIVVVPSVPAPEP